MRCDLAPIAHARILVAVLAVPAALGTQGCRGVLGIDALAPSTADGGGGDGGDGSDVGDAPGARYCATLSPPAQLCADFDGTAAYGEGFDNGAQNPDPGAQKGGTLALDALLFRSGPASLLVQTPPLLQTNDAAAAVLLKTLPSVTPRLGVSFDIFITTEDIPAGGGGFVILAAVDYGIGGVLFLRDARGPAIAVVPDGPTVHLPMRFPLGTWKTVNLTIQNEPVDGGVDGMVDGGVDAFLEASIVLPQKFQKVTSKPHLTIGPSAGGPVGAFKANIDNVRVYYGS